MSRRAPHWEEYSVGGVSSPPNAQEGNHVIIH
jgi:hypothetical protein